MSGELDTINPISIAENWRQVLGTRQPVNYVTLHFAEIVDTEGVSIKSDRSLLPEASDGSIDWEYGVCPYVTSPSRSSENQDPDSQKPMSFLERRRLAQNYPTLLGMAKHIRGALFDKAGDKPLDSARASRVLAATRFAAHYLVFRATEPLDPDNVPPSLVIAHNAALGGLTGLGNGMSGQTGAKIAAGTPAPTIDKILQETERKGVFVGEKTVCAAPPSMIRHFLDAVIAGTNLERIEVPEWFADQVPSDEVAKLSRFADSLQLFEVANTVVVRYDRVSAQLIMAELANQNRKKPNKRNPRRIRGFVTQFIDSTEAYSRNMTGARYAINDCLGRNRPAPGYDSMASATQAQMPLLIEELFQQNPDYLPPSVLTRMSADE